MYLAWREIKRNRMKFSLIAVIFILIAWLVFILSGLGNGLQTLAAASFKNMKADYVVLEQGSNASVSKSLLSADGIDIVSKMPNVRGASPVGTTMGTVLKGDASDPAAGKVDVAMIGIEAGSFLEPAVIEGSGLSSDRADGAIVNKSMKDEGFKLGDTLRLDGSNETLTIVGFVENETYNHVASVFLPIDKWRTITFAAPGSDKGIRNPVNALILQGSKIDPDAVNAALQGTDTVTLAAAIMGMPGYKEESGSITMMLAFLLVISAFMLGVFFYVFTLQKSNQFGVLKAIGARNGFLGKAVVSQVMVLSIFSILVGVALTYAVASFLSKAMPFILDTKLVIIYSIILLVIALLSSLASVRSITRIDPLKALGRVE
ncbi:ABC transporter permease [Paenibacillus sp. PR3]|uniref:Putative hemin transport system permease protein HrtB n=1 Tax=Paenibacillus terricola TaxID=2763503 RepID=A0ABR8MWZ8_9BACL|nr:ABC transporter permease [Paenibacillus terricola]MBD3920501.1 ABC transporter permease [Paenibacillus terricola]